MRIILYTVSDRESSIYLMAVDMAGVLERPGVEVEVVVKMGDIKACDVLLNLWTKDIIKLHKLRRFVGIGQIVNLFTSHPNIYLDMEFGYIGLSAKKYPIICHSAYLYSLVVTRIKQVFGSSSRAILKNVYCVPFGILPAFKCMGRNDPHKFITPFNRCDNTYKDYGTHARLTTVLCAMLLRQGIKTRHIFKHSSHKSAHLIDWDTSMYETSLQEETREKYIETVGDYGVFFCVSKLESFGLYYLELLKSGVVGVFLDKLWIRQLLPDYKFIAKNESELIGMVIAILNDYSKAQRYILKKVVPYIDKYYSLEVFCSRFLKEFCGRDNK